MCGIAGYFRIDAAASVDDALLGRMLRAVAHRGPDDEGVFADDRVALGFRRLSIIDPAHGRQPCANEDGHIISICNGEIFNYQALRAGLIARGHRFRTQGDTEVLVHLYEERGIALLDDLNGQFACAIYDADRRRLYLARDQFGVAPLFYAIVGGVLLFASEMKALLEHPGVSRRVDLRALDQILTLPGIVSPSTIFEAISSLASGHYLEVTTAGVRPAEYWDLDYPRDGDMAPRPDAYYTERLTELLLRSIEYRLQSDVPVGLYLSGGLDSSLVAAMTKHVRPETRLSSFSVSFGGASMCEGRYQRLVARQIDSMHYDIPVDAATVLRRLPAAVYHSETPLRETYNTASLELSCAAKAQSVSVVLGGEGADEFFAGYVGYRFDQIRQARRGQMLDGRGTELHELFGIDAPVFYERDRAAVRALRAEMLSAPVNDWLDRAEAAPSAINPDRLEGRHPVHQRSYLDLKLRLADHLLADHGDRMALAHAVEARYPFLDIDLVQFAREIPPRLKLNGYVEKFVVREVARDFVPAAVLSREKFGWFTAATPALLSQRDEHLDYLLSPGKIASDRYFNASSVERLRQRYRADGFALAPPFDTDLLAIVITFGLLADQFNIPTL